MTTRKTISLVRDEDDEQFPRAESFGGLKSSPSAICAWKQQGEDYHGISVAALGVDIAHATPTSVCIKSAHKSRSHVLATITHVEAKGRRQWSTERYAMSLSCNLYPQRRSGLHHFAASERPIGKADQSGLQRTSVSISSACRITESDSFA